MVATTHSPPPSPFFAEIIKAGSNTSVLPLSPRAQTKSLAALLSIGVVSKHNGKDILEFSDTEIDKLAEPFKFALVGKFSHDFPQLNALRKHFSNLLLKGDYAIRVLNLKSILINLSNEDDFARIWLHVEYFFNGFSMRVFKWSPEFEPNIESSIAPVWIQLPGLPIHLFDKRALRAVASLMGKPLRLDEPTANKTRLNVARLCMEIDLTIT